METLAQIQSLVEQGRLNKAEVMLAHYLRQSDRFSKECVQALVIRAEISLQTARPERALEDLAAAREIDQDYYKTAHVQRVLADSHFVRFELGSVGFSRKQDLLRAEQIYNTIMRSHPDYHGRDWVCYQLGRILLITDQSDKATEHFESVVSDPTADKRLVSYCYERLAFIALHDKRNPVEALQYIRQIPLDQLQETGESEWIIQTLLLKSRALLANNRTPEAINLFSDIREYASSVNNGREVLPLTLLHIAEQLSGIPGHDYQVLQYLNQFLQIARSSSGVDVTRSRVYELMGNAQADLGRYDNAIQSYETAMQFNPDSPWRISVYYRIAKCYYQTGRYRKTVSAINSALAYAQSEGESLESNYLIYDILGSAYFALRDYEKAYDAFALAQRHAPAGTTLSHKIQLYYCYSAQLLKRDIG